MHPDTGYWKPFVLIVNNNWQVRKVGKASEMKEPTGPNSTHLKDSLEITEAFNYLPVASLVSDSAAYPHNFVLSTRENLSPIILEPSEISSHISSMTITCRPGADSLSPADLILEDLDISIVFSYLFNFPMKYSFYSNPVTH